MTDAVFDASALIAYFSDEPGADRVEAALSRGGLISAVNWAEILAKASDAGVSPAAFADAATHRGILGQLLEVVPFNQDAAAGSASLRADTRTRGLSLGDRACLDLARRTRLPVFTADRAWADLELGINVLLIR